MIWCFIYSRSRSEEVSQEQLKGDHGYLLSTVLSCISTKDSSERLVVLGWWVVWTHLSIEPPSTYREAEVDGSWGPNIRRDPSRSRSRKLIFFNFLQAGVQRSRSKLIDLDVIDVRSKRSMGFSDNLGQSYPLHQGYLKCSSSRTNLSPPIQSGRSETPSCLAWHLWRSWESKPQTMAWVPHIVGQSNPKTDQTVKAPSSSHSAPTSGTG